MSDSKIKMSYDKLKLEEVIVIKKKLSYDELNSEEISYREKTECFGVEKRMKQE